MRAAALLALFGLVLMIGACSDTGQEDVLAAVNGEPILGSEVDLALERLSPAAGDAGDEVRNNVVESLVRARAVAALAERSLDEEQLQEVALRARLYRDELLVAALLKKEAVVEPVTDAMIKDYYARHQEKFSQGRRLRVQYLQSAVGLEKSLRTKLMQRLSALNPEADWQAAHRSLVAEGFELTWHDIQVQQSLLDAPLGDLVAGLEAGEASKVLFGDQVYRARVLAVHEAQPKPLREVSAEIRKALAAVQLQKAVGAIADRALTEAEVEYFEE